MDNFLEDSIYDNRSFYEAGSGKYLAAGAAGLGAVIAAKPAGKLAGQLSIKKDDPHYDMNRRSGEALFRSKQRSFQREDIEEAINYERFILPGAAAGAAAIAGTRAIRGIKQGKLEKRQSGTNTGYVDAYNKHYGRKEEVNEFEEDELQEIGAGILKGVGGLARRLKPGKKTAIAGIAGAGLAGAASVPAYKGAKKFGGAVMESGLMPVNEADSYGMRNDVANNRILFRHQRGKALGIIPRKPKYGAVQGAQIRRTESSNPFEEDQVQEAIGPAAGSALKWTGRSLAGLDIGILGAQGGKAVLNRNKGKQKESELEERLKGQAAQKGIQYALQHSGKADTTIFGLSTANSGYNKSQDIRDDRRLNQSHRR